MPTDINRPKYAVKILFPFVEPTVTTSNWPQNSPGNSHNLATRPVSTYFESTHSVPTHSVATPLNLGPSFSRSRHSSLLSRAWHRPVHTESIDNSDTAVHASQPKGSVRGLSVRQRESS